MRDAASFVARKEHTGASSWRRSGGETAPLEREDR